MDVIMIRLDKYLADMCIGTRTEVKKLIRQGKVKIGDAVVKTPEQKIDIATQKVFCEGQEVGYEEYEYYILNKPAGYVSATTDPKDKTVLDLITDKKRKDLFPVGRLDKDTEGLLLITNDGDLAHRLLAPKNHVDKLYYAKVEGVVTEEDVRAFAEGVNIGEDEVTRPAVLEILKSDEVSEIHLTIQEGKFHQVKRMFEKIDNSVTYLKRVQIGALSLDGELPLGEMKELSEGDLELLWI